MDQLPEEIQCKIISSFDFSSLVKLSSVSKQYNYLCNLDRFWKPLCEKIWLSDDNEYTFAGRFDLDGNSKTWKETFEYFYALYGRYVNCFADVKTVWDRIVGFTRQNVPMIYDSFLPGVTEDDLRYFEERSRSELPDELRCLYRLCGGQRYGSQGLFGSYDEGDQGDLFANFNEYYGNDPDTDWPQQGSPVLSRCFPIEEICCYPFVTRESLRDDRQFLAVYLKPSAVSGTSDSAHPGLRVHNSTSSEIPDLDYGSVVSCSCMDTADYHKSQLRMFVYEKSILDFLRKFADKLQEYPIHNGRILKFELNSEGSTGPFTVITRTSFVREQSYVVTRENSEEDRKFVYRYYIIIKMDPEARPSDSCQLETRHWIITDEDGNVERVDGPGVVGQFPTMRPGASHYWISGTSYKTLTGTMGGHFTMRNLTTGQPVRINCPDYVMKAPKIVYLSARD